MFWLNYSSSYYIKPLKWHAFNESKRLTLYDDLCLLNFVLKFFNIFNEETTSVITRSPLNSINNSITLIKERKFIRKMLITKEKASFTLEANKR